ncbi:hypothetical protein [Emticicia fluvialis]|uniref:hypothetical protein n=1 Tax=Emticicia fluvialis TaxID=2974474 RepID=UPI0021658E5B|nr:hypothetical protein [Emticicia fluvialis]
MNDLILLLSDRFRADIRVNKSLLLVSPMAVSVIFEKVIGRLIFLDAKLNVSGLLFIDHSNFDFMYSSLYERYEPLAFENNHKERPRPLFGRHNKKVAEVTYVIGRSEKNAKRCIRRSR